MTLGAAAGQFWSRPSPRIIGVVLAVVVGVRVALGDWNWHDLIVVAAILAFEPFTEWLIHVFVLHFKPFDVGGRHIDPLVSRKHREHHADPKDLDLVFIPMPVVLFALVIGVAAPLLIAPDARIALSAMVGSFGMLLTYEWTHFLIHTAYRPSTTVYRKVWRAHRLHHFRNERYWFGVTMHLADHVLRTYPAKDAVPLSPTATTLSAGLEPV